MQKRFYFSLLTTVLIMLKFWKGQPDYTFYTLTAVTTFVDYAKTLAQQWLDNIITDN